MPVPVAGEKNDVAAPDATESERAGGFAVGRATGLALRGFQVAELVKAAAADDRQHQESRMARISGRLRQ